MPRYFTVHSIACVTRQNLRSLAERLQGDPAVKLVRMAADTMEGGMICEFESPSSDLLRAFLARHQVHVEKILRAEHEFPGPS